MLILILILPFLNTFSILLFGRYIGIKGVIFNSILIYLGLIFLLIYTNMLVFIYNDVIHIQLFNIIPSINFGIIFNRINLSLLTPVIIISFVVNIYTRIYLEGDPFIIRFFGYLNLFSSFMILLVISDNLLFLFFGWEGIGIASFLLISYYYNSSESIKSSLSAFFINKLGDLFLIFGIILIYFYNCFEYSNLIGFGLIVASTTKSAQLPFTKWLPESMCAPTPVSSLLHAATLVTAGVFLLVKTWIFLNSDMHIIILCIGTITTFLSGFYALFQNDIKRIIAFSTCSQIAMCFVAIGLSQYTLSIYHLFNHSFYKALLFLSSGVIIHKMNNIQDVRQYGGLSYYLPITQICFLIGGLSLMAIPGLSGFYSKDLIIESSIMNNYVWPFIYISGYTTAAYTMYLYFNTFNVDNKNSIQPLIESKLITHNLTQNDIEKENWSKPKYTIETSVIYPRAENENIWYIIPLTILAIFSIFAGYFTQEYKSTLDEIYNSNMDFEFLIDYWQVRVIFIFTVFLAWLFSYISLNSNKVTFPIIPSLTNKGYIDYLTNIITTILLKLSNNLNNTIEQGIIKSSNEILINYISKISNTYNMNFSILYKLTLIFILIVLII